MIIGEALYSYLSTYAGLIALTNTRIYPTQAPEGVAKPYVTFEKLAATRLHTLQTDPGVAEALFQFDCWASTALSAWQVAAQIRAALRDYTGLMGGASGVTIMRIIGPENEDDGYDYQSETYSTTVEFRVWHFE